jgi:hypothetical protein
MIYCYIQIITTTSHEIVLNMFLAHDENVMSHTTNVLELESSEYQWHIHRLPYPSKKECQALQANTWHPCKAKVGKSKHDTLKPTYRGPKKELSSNNHIAT